MMDTLSVGSGLKECKKRIHEYLSTVSTKTLKDELAILHYSQRLGVRINSIPRVEDYPQITFETFCDWLRLTLPKNGDIIVLHESQEVCIVKSVGVSTFQIAASLSKEDVLSTQETEIPFCLYTDAYVEEKRRLQNALYKKGLVWSAHKTELIERLNPHENQQVRISLLGEKLGLGVFREVNDNNEAVFFCVKMDNEPLGYSLYEIIGKFWDFQFEIITTCEREELANILTEANVVWNGHFKRIEPLNYRARKGETYNFIDDCFEIIVALDNYKLTHDKRLKAGNYFKVKEEAEDMIKHIYAALPTTTGMKVKTGENYFYVGSTFRVSKTKNRDYYKDNLRHKRGNYFIGNTQAGDLIKLINEYRKEQLVNFNDLYKNHLPQNKK